MKHPIKNSKERAKNIIPGKGYVQYSRIEPLGSIFGTAADLSEAQR